jgi:hypothetical protein
MGLWDSLNKNLQFYENNKQSRNKQKTQQNIGAVVAVIVW